ncbi:hypothetical protein M8494_16370 [Serratia ureilytica]
MASSDAGICMMNDKKDLSTRQTFRRLWPMITPFKTGLIGAIALIMNAAELLMLSLLKPLLDDGFGKTDSSDAGVDATGGDCADADARRDGFVSNYCISWVPAWW